MDAKTGEQVYRERVPEIAADGWPVHASPVLSAGRLDVTTRWDGVLVYPALPTFELAAPNGFAGDESDMSGTPASTDGRLFLRSGRFLYCLADAAAGANRR